MGVTAIAQSYHHLTVSGPPADVHEFVALAYTLPIDLPQTLARGIVQGTELAGSPVTDDIATSLIAGVLSREKPALRLSGHVPTDFELVADKQGWCVVHWGTPNEVHMPSQPELVPGKLMVRFVTTVAAPLAWLDRVSMHHPSLRFEMHSDHELGEFATQTVYGPGDTRVVEDVTAWDHRRQCEWFDTHFPTSAYHPGYEQGERISDWDYALRA